MPKSVNPVTGEIIKEIASFDNDQIELALANASAQFKSWRSVSFADRAQVLSRAADLLDQRKDELAELATNEMGKLFVQAQSEIEKCAWVCRYYAENAEHFLKDDMRESDSKESFVRYLPIGVVLAVMPWNFPFWQVLRFAAPTLMAGNVGLLKHASNVSQCALAIEKLFLDAGAPQGVFQTLIVGSDKVQSIIDDKRVAAVTLTGSGPAGSKVASQAGAAFKPSLLELGGSDAFIVMPSADFDTALETAVKARMINNGQSCIAAKRFIVHADIYEQFKAGYVERVRNMVIGDPMDQKTDIGPLSSADIRDELVSQVARLKKEGAKVLTGGVAVEGNGYYFEPSVIAEIPENSKEAQQEFFGPVALLYKANDIDQAIEIANNSPFGLGSSAWTKDEKEQKKFVDQIEAGSTFINSMVASDPRLPFGGIKESGYGRELSKEGILAFVNAKTISISD